MKQVLQYTNGELKVEDVPPPALRGGGVLVAVNCSLVSTGTERMTMELAKKSLVGKALERPDLVKQVLAKMKTEGFSSTLQKVKGKLDTPIALGYSCAGVVVGVAEDVDEFAVGDRVACAGAGYASHAEFIFVPRNLCVKIPDSVDFPQAAYVTLGSIAMQGIRVANVSFGECVMVNGLGLVGQLAVQILKSAGCRVMGVDVDADRAELALKSGADAVAIRNRDDVKEVASAFSRGRGIDAVVITAATSSNDPVELAGEVLRDKGRVAVVGAVKMDIPRKPFYEKELDLRLSRSYGPGRYDSSYEENGVDYPIGFVRWTERRNMESFLDMIACGGVRPDELTTHSFDIADAASAYSMIGAKDGTKFLGVVLNYPQHTQAPKSVVAVAPATSAVKDKLVIGVIGAGNFAQGVLLPNLSKIENVHISAINTRDGVKAKRVAERYGAKYATTNPEDIFADSDVDAVIISTRHDTHVSLAIKAMESGKSVFVEKPLALNSEQLDELVAARERTGKDVVVDFNRRRSPLVMKMIGILGRRTRPLVMNYRINAGFIPKDSWIQDIEQGGGRIIGEGCHFIDLMSHICGAKPVEVYAAGAYGSDESRTNRDNAIVTLKFADGSIGTLVYVADGDTRLPKERLEVFGSGCSLVIDDFKTGTYLYGGKSEKMNLPSQDKGHADMLRAFVEFARGNGESPVPLDEAVAVTRATYAVLESMGLGVTVPLL